MKAEDVRIFDRRRIGGIGQRDALSLKTRAFLGQPPPCVIDQNPSHLAGGNRVKVSAALPVDRVLADQPKVRLVHQRARLERMAKPLLP